MPPREPGDHGIDLSVEEDTPLIEVRRADHRPDTIDDDRLRVENHPLRFVDLHIDGGEIARKEYRSVAQDVSAVAGDQGTFGDRLSDALCRRISKRRERRERCYPGGMNQRQVVVLCHLGNLRELLVLASDGAVIHRHAPADQSVHCHRHRRTAPCGRGRRLHDKATVPVVMPTAAIVHAPRGSGRGTLGTERREPATPAHEPSGVERPFTGPDRRDSRGLGAVVQQIVPRYRRPMARNSAMEGYRLFLLARHRSTIGCVIERTRGTCEQRYNDDRKTSKGDDRRHDVTPGALQALPHGCRRKSATASRTRAAARTHQCRAGHSVRTKSAEPLRGALLNLGDCRR
jgi:hypothetical protein